MGHESIKPDIHLRSVFIDRIKTIKEKTNQIEENPQSLRHDFSDKRIRDKWITPHEHIPVKPEHLHGAPRFLLRTLFPLISNLWGPKGLAHSPPPTLRSNADWPHPVSPLWTELTQSHPFGCHLFHRSISNLSPKLHTSNRLPSCNLTYISKVVCLK